MFLNEELNVNVFFANTEVKKMMCSDKTVLKFPQKVTDINTLKKVLSKLKVSLLDDLQKKSAEIQKQKFIVIQNIKRKVNYVLRKI